MLLLPKPLVVGQVGLLSLLLLDYLLVDRRHHFNLIAVFILHHHHFTSRAFGSGIDLTLSGLVETL